MKKAIKWISLSLIGLYLIFGFFILPYLITSQSPQIVKEQIGGDFKIKSASFNPLSFELKLKGIKLLSPDSKPLFSLKEFVLNFEPYALFSGAIRLKEIALIEPEIFIEKESEKRFNFSWLLGSNESSDEKEAAVADEKSSLPTVVMEYFYIENAAINYADKSKKVPFNIAFEKLGFRVFDINTKNLHHSDGNIRFFTHVNDGGFIDFHSKLVSLEPFAIKGGLDFESGKIFTGWSYLRDILNLEIADGKMYAHADFLFDGADINATRVENISLSMNRLRIKPKDRDNDILHVKKIELNDGSLYPLQQQGVFDTFAINDISLHVKRNSDGSVDWQKYAEVSVDESKQEDSNSTESKPWDITLKHFKIDRFRVDIYDEMIKPAQHFRLNDFNFSADNIHSLPNQYLNYKMALRFNEKMLCKSEGRLAHSYLDAEGSFTCKGIDLTWFNEYIKDVTSREFKKFDVALASSDVKFSLPYQIHQDKNETAFILDDASFRLSDFKLKQKSLDKTLIRWSYFEIDKIDIDTSKESLHVSDIILNKPRVYAKKSKDKLINFESLIEPKQTSQPKQESESNSSKESSGYKVAIDNVNIKRGALFFTDASLSKTVRMSVNELNLHVKDISSDLSHRFSYNSNMRINKKAKLFLIGDIKPEPLHVRSSINLKSLQLTDANAYLAETLRVYLERGYIDLNAKVNYEPLNSRAEMMMRGKVSINDFVANNSQTDKTLIAFKEVSASPFYFDMKPDRLSIEELKISQLYSNIHIDKNKVLNLSKLSKENNTTTPQQDKNTTQKASEPFPVNIVKLDFKDGTTDFADDSLPLKFHTHIHDVNGKIYGISTEKELTSYVNLDGVIDKYGAMKVDGSLNSGDPKSFTDISVNFRNLALNNMSPYSANFAGRKIDEGKLFLNLKYKIVESKILGDNSIIIKKIKLGEEFEGESSLPLGLAVALLEDSDGIIDIDMPVEGDMDAPDFKYGALVMKTLGNLIIKIVSSPFSFLGSMLGIDGDELKYIAYEAGDSTLLPPEREKLDALAKALSKRPKLSLSITGTYSKTDDTFALQRKKLEALVVKRSGQKESKILLNTAFVEKLYDEFYKDDSRAKIKAALKKEHKEQESFIQAYREDMLKAIVIKQQVSTDELLALAKKRAQRVVGYLNVTHSIANERIVVKESVDVEKSDEGFIDSAMEIIVKDK
jgi:uncharacterized protein involved in outer membrane biogenesis